MKTASATRAATKAVEGVKTKFAAYDTLAELTKAAAAIKETQRHLRNSAWNDAVESYSSILSSVVRVIELSTSLSDPQEDALRSLMEEVKITSDRLEMAISKKSFRFDAAKASALARSHLSILTQVTVSMEKVL